MNLTYSEVIRREPDHTHFDRPKPKKKSLGNHETTHDPQTFANPAPFTGEILRQRLEELRSHAKPKTRTQQAEISRRELTSIKAQHRETHPNKKKNPDISIPLPASPAQHRGWHDIHRPRQHTSRVEEEEGRSRRQAELTGGTDLGARGRGNGRSAASSTSGSGDPAGARVAGADPTAGRCAVRLSRRGGASFFFLFFFRFFFLFSLGLCALNSKRP